MSMPSVLFVVLLRGLRPDELAVPEQSTWEACELFIELQNIPNEARSSDLYDRVNVYPPSPQQR